MEKEDIRKTVCRFLVDEIELDEEKLTDGARLKEDLGIDSLDFVDIVVICEREFGFKIKPEEMKNVRTLGQFYDYIGEKLG
ncbi:MAG: acyl carrier protein [Bacteroidetes bacterium]|uniref:Acyl carrier protein n=1 Tax=Candidatus Merdivivens pullistercoris TaxID=2840873 RepID=A0A9D9I514_9BACT|nr:acyl carrier protein [Candidatus Merdivivens pullistercoris]